MDYTVGLSISEASGNGWGEGVTYLANGMCVDDTDHLRTGTGITFSNNRYEMTLRGNSGDSHRNWINLFIQGVKDKTITVRLKNTNDCPFFMDPPYPSGVFDPNNQNVIPELSGMDPMSVYMVYTYDGVNWGRIKDYSRGSSDNGYFQFTHTFTENVVQICSQFPSSVENIRTFEQEVEPNPLVTIETIGQTSQGREVHMLHITNSSPEKEKYHIATITQQHPGETHSTIIAEEMIREILSDTRYVNKIHWYFVLGVNVDGIYLGNSRRTSDGSNPNSAWGGSSVPCVNAVKSRLGQVKSEYGLDMLLDFHSLAGRDVVGYMISNGASMSPSNADSIRSKVYQNTTRVIFDPKTRGGTRHSTGGFKGLGDSGGTMEHPLRTPTITLQELYDAGRVWTEEIFNYYDGETPPDPEPPDPEPPLPEEYVTKAELDAELELVEARFESVFKQLTDYDVLLTSRLNTMEEWIKSYSG